MEIDQLKIFIENASESRFGKSEWLHFDFMQVYVRKGFHKIENKLCTCLDIASIEVDEEKQNQGLFKNFLLQAHDLNPWDATYIENVLNPHLAKHLIKNGWIQIGESFYKTKTFEQAL
jgi:hypothetical protein